MAEKHFDMKRINTLLHYEKIPGFVMTAEQRKYLDDYRNELAVRPAFKKKDLKGAKVFGSRFPMKGEESDEVLVSLASEATKEPESAIDEIADMIAKKADEAPKTKKKSSKKTVKKVVKEVEAVESI